MMTMEIVVPIMFALFATGAGACIPLTSPRRLLRIPVYTSAGASILAIPMIVHFSTGGTFFLYGRNLVVDHLSLYHILLVDLVFLISSIYGTGYFEERIRGHAISLWWVKRYCMLWQAFHAILLLVLMSNNIGVMWVALEATTLVSAFLILSDTDVLSIEAMWKYLLVCSVGIVFAFMGTVLTVAAARNIHDGSSLYLFSQLSSHPEMIDPRLMLFAFIFVVVGYGTKAGLSPMHTWLPDAHSQAPTPVSAVFSGVMLNCALFCIVRYLPVTDAALGRNGEAHSILLLLGFMSLIFAAVFVPAQHDMKRLLAYHSVEHMGIIVVGLGIGGFGTFAAMLHTLNHSLSKTLAFFSAGHIADRYGTRDMRLIRGAVRHVPLWGSTLFLSLLVLIGVAPFAVFMSEFFIVKEAFFQKRYFVVALFLFSALAIFISALKHTMDVSFGDSPDPQETRKPVRIVDGVIVLACLLVLLLLGLWIPTPFADFLYGVSSAIENGVRP
jgi:hydrogenase-4 component F